VDLTDAPARLADFILEHLDESARARVRATGDLAQILACHLEEARDAWMDVEISSRDFAEYLAERLPSAEDPVQALGGLHAKDLYLACACAQGAPRAIEHFECDCLAQIGPALRKLDVPYEVVQDATQHLRKQLFTVQADGAPGICKYSGRGTLVAWLRVTATRTAIRLARKERRELPLEDDRLEHIADSADDPELEYLKQVYRKEFNVSFAEAMQAITPRQRNLFRHHLVDRLSIDEIGALYRVHRATAARWLAVARETMVRLTRKAMISRLHLDPEEYQSIMRLIQSRIDFSISQHLKTSVPPDVP